MILGDLLDELFRSLFSVGDSHDGFRRGGDAARWMKNLETVDKLFNSIMCEQS